MNERNAGKLNQLGRELPEGLLVDAAWLEARGYYRSLRKKYVDLGWLEQPAYRVYRRPRGTLSWEQVVISLQTLLQVPVVVGGRSALELEGYGHYLPQHARETHLYGTDLPSWLNKLPLENEFVVHRTGRVFLDDPVDRGLARLEEQDNEGSFATEAEDVLNRPWGQWRWPLALSVPERALLELLDELPARESFHQVDKLMEGLVNLRPGRLQALLKRCTNVKIKRLFFFFADRSAHAWLKRIDRDAIDLGKGKRMLVRGGRFDPVYQITVPKDLDAVS